MNILGIDPGSRYMGYALVPPWDPRRFQLTQPILIGTTRHTSQDIERRMVAAQKAIEEVLIECESHGPFCIVYEEPPSQWRSNKGGAGREAQSTRVLYAWTELRNATSREPQSREPSSRAIPVSSWRKVARQLGMIKGDSQK